MTVPADFLTTKQFAQAVGCPTPTVHGWVARGIVTPAGKKGKSSLFAFADVEKMKAFRALNPGKARASSVVASVVVELAASAEAPKTSTSGHRYGVRGPTVGTPEILSFGPISLKTIVDNTPAGQAMVPTLDPNFVFDAGEAVVLANALSNDESTWIWGPTGAGKTSGIQQVCALRNQPLYRVNMSGDFTVSDFVGSTKVVVDETSGQAVTEFSDGVLLKAMLEGGVLLIDEVTATPASVLMALQAVLERGVSTVQFVNTENGGEVIHAHPLFRILVTDNTNGQGDLTGAYSGTHVMNEAFRSRFTQWLRKGYPEGKTWSKMVAAKTGLSFENATKIVKLAREVNKGSALLGASKVTNQMVISPRDTLSIARLFSVYGDMKVSFRIGLIDSMHVGDADRQFVIDLLNSMI